MNRQRDFNIALLGNYDKMIQYCRGRIGKFNIPLPQQRPEFQNTENWVPYRESKAKVDLLCGHTVEKMYVHLHGREELLCPICHHKRPWPRCYMCGISKARTVCYPCKHVVTCRSCSFVSCPICLRHINEHVCFGAWDYINGYHRQISEYEQRPISYNE